MKTKIKLKQQELITRTGIEKQDDRIVRKSSTYQSMHMLDNRIPLKKDSS